MASSSLLLREQCDRRAHAPCSLVRAHSLAGDIWTGIGGSTRCGISVEAVPMQAQRSQYPPRVD
eukprot:1726456-Prymnesium_polylepis.1